LEGRDPGAHWRGNTKGFNEVMQGMVKRKSYVSAVVHKLLCFVGRVAAGANIGLCCEVTRV